jgi:hypothetical protein
LNQWREKYLGDLHGVILWPTRKSRSQVGERSGLGVPNPYRDGRFGAFPPLPQCSYKPTFACAAATDVTGQKRTFRRPSAEL